MFEGTGGLAQLIEHTLVRPDATPDDLAAACAEATEHGFAALIVSGAHVRHAAALLQGTNIPTGAVVGFPHGACTTTVKIVEAMEAVKNGAAEIDIMINLGYVKAGRYDLVEIDLKNVIAMTPRIIHKVILETGMLGPAEIARASTAAVRSGAEFIKTCTGYGPRGATVEDIRLIRESVRSACRIKASGGIRTLAQVTALVAAGAERIGTSAGPAIMRECPGAG